MKIQNHILTTLVLISILLQLLSSCSPTNNVASSSVIQKRKYSPGYHVSAFSATNETPTIKPKYLKELSNISAKKLVYGSKNTEANDEFLGEMLVSNEIEDAVLPPNRIKFATTKVERVSLLVEDCDIITLKNGEEIKAKIMEISASEIKYKKCSYLDGPTYSIKTAEVFMIKYPNGDKDVISGESYYDQKTVEDASPETDAFPAPELKVQPLALSGFISSIVGLLVFGFVFGPVGLILSGIGLGKITRNPDVWKGKGFAIAGIIMGIVATVLSIIVLAIIL